MPSGFKPPGYTQMPDEIFDFLMADLSGAQLKVLLYVARRTLGWRKEADAISLHQICNGITTRDGRQLDKGTGLSREGAIQAIAALSDGRSLDKRDGTKEITEGLGLLIAEQRFMGDTKASLPTVYRLNIYASDTSEVVRKSDYLEEPRWSENLTTTSQKNGPPIALPVVRKSDPQETVKRQTVDNIQEPLPSLSEQKELQNQNHSSTGMYTQVEGSKEGANTTDEWCELNLEDDIVTFTKNAYSVERRLRVKPKLETKGAAEIVQKLQNSEAAIGKVEFRLALLKYLREDSVWNRQNDWPLYNFLKNHTCYPGRAAAAPAQRSVPEPRNTSSQAHAIAPGSDLPQTVQRWNAAVIPELQVTDWSKASPTKQLAEAEADPQFWKNFHAICQRCCLYAKAGQLPGTFDWLFMTSKGQLNWYRTAKNLTPWAEKPKGEAFQQAKPKSTAEMYIERMEREIAEEEKQKHAGT